MDREHPSRDAHRDAWSLADELLHGQREWLADFLSRSFGARLGEVECERVLGDTLDRAKAYFPSFDRRRALRPWLTRIARHCALNRLEDLGRPAPDAARRSEVSYGQYLSELIESEKREALRIGLAELSPEERAIVLKEEPSRSLGLRLGCTSGHVDNLRCCLMKRLRARVLRIWSGGWA